jgi:hypothetical protein
MDDAAIYLQHGDRNRARRSWYVAQKTTSEKGHGKTGRKVEDRELTSITEWMDALPDERPGTKTSRT